MNASGNSIAGTKKEVKANQNIQVYVRVRPTNARERAIRSFEVVEVPNHREIVARQYLDAKTSKKFTFDRAFGHDAKQNEVYHVVVAPMIDEVLAGYNCTVFAYGQTGTGKTYTMVGEETPELRLSWEDDAQIGIIPRALSHLFDELRMMEVEFSMRISYLELYNEELCDLLSTDDSVKIRIFDDSTKKGSVIVQGLEEIPVHSKDDVYKLLAKGQERRKTASTLMNAQSSRSHTVFSITVHIKENGIDGEEMLKCGKLNLVDLAGSENISKAGNEGKGIRTRETVNINQSLLTLGRVITALVERTPHIPYRESKLTRLLQESLGGRTKTSIIATISPGHKDLEETLSTLDYAHRAKNIQNRPEINQRLTKKAVLKEYTEEIDKLKRDLMAARDKNGIYLAEDTYADMMGKIDSSTKELNDKVLLIKTLKEELASKQKLFAEVSYNLIERTEQLKETEERLTHTRSELGSTKQRLQKTKRRFEEKRHLMEKHAHTEQVLSGQARELIVEAEKAASDSGGLHEAIERRKAVEREVESACERFTAAMQDGLGEINTKLVAFGEAYGEQSSFIRREMESTTKQHKNLADKAQTTLIEMAESRKSDSGQRLDYVIKFRERLGQFSAENRDVIVKIFGEIREEEEKRLKTMEELTTDILGQLQSQQDAISEHQEKISTCIAKKDNLVTDLIESQLEKLKNHSESLEKSFETECSTVVATLEANEALQTEQQKEMEHIQAEFNAFVERMNGFMLRGKETSAKISSVASNLAQIRQESSIYAAETLKQSADFKSAYEKEGNEEKKLEKETSTILSTHRASNESKIPAIQSTNASISQSVLSATTAGQTASTSAHLALQKETDALHVSLAEFELATDARTAERHSTIVSTLNDAHDHIATHMTTASSLHQAIERSVHTFEDAMKHQIRDASDRTERFRRDELKTYRPSGETPTRREYQIRHELVATSPHDRIIKRFRLERGLKEFDASAASEVSVMDESGEMLVNSTPFKLPDTVTERNELKELQFSDFITSKIVDIEDKENFNHNDSLQQQD